MRTESGKETGFLEAVTNNRNRPRLAVFFLERLPRVMLSAVPCSKPAPSAASKNADTLFSSLDFGLSIDQPVFDLPSTRFSIRKLGAVCSAVARVHVTGCTVWGAPRGETCASIRLRTKVPS